MYYYNKNVRPVKNTSEPLKVKFGASLIRIIDVDEVNQVLTTNLWMEMHWYDYKLSWDPVKFNNIKKLHIPADQIWIPDILLYNNADGEPHISIMSDAIVYYTGMVVWKPPSIYKSFCQINIEYFPYDEQSCRMKFGGWSYNGFLMDISQLPSRPEDLIETLQYEDGREYQFLKQGMDLSFFYPSLEWDVMALTSKRHEQLYPGCCGQDMYIDITFEVSLRRKTLFYTVNLVIPCMLIAILTTFVFYIPAIEHKCTFSISILVTLTVFYLVLIELIPPTSLVIPLIGKYLLFTMFLVTASILLSVVTINVYRRDGTSHPMPSWMHHVFLKTLPKYLCIKPPEDDSISDDGSTISEIQVSATNSRRASPYFLSVASMVDTEMRLSQLAQLRGMHPDVIRRMIDNVAFISDHFRALKKQSKISEDWSYVAMVMDRCLLIIFAILNLVGTILIFVQSPSWYDERQPLQVLPPSKPLSGDTYEYILKTGNFTAPWPVKNTSEPLKVKFGASLIRIIDVDEVNQVLTTNLWMEMHWYDYKLSWDPVKFNNIKKLHIPADQIWIPDILLYNNADGEPHISIMSDAIVYYTGMVVWKPPSIYKSFCQINIEYFPYDEQSCRMKFGGWSYNGLLMNISQLPSRPEDSIETLQYEDGREYQFLKQGMDLSFFYPSLEWDVMELTSKRHEKIYPGCCGQDMYIDITFEVSLRRKTLFYTVNLVIPCMLIAILTTFVFYIPAIEHKCTFSISILVTLTVFYLVLIELIPPTSLVIPLIGKYLLFTMFLVTASILLSVVTINVYRRDGTSHPMPSWMHHVFLKTLPKYLCIKPPEDDSISDDGSTISEIQVSATNSRRASPYFLSVASMVDSEMRLSQLAQLRGMHPDVIRRMIDNVAFISDHFRALKKQSKISEDWSYVAMVMDRCLLIIFAIFVLVGTILIFVQSPSWYDERQPLQVLPPSKPLSGDTYESILKTGNLTASW